MPTMPFDFAISALLTLFVVVDPVGLTPTFLVVTEGLPRKARRSVALRASMIALAPDLRYLVRGENGASL